MPITTPKVPDGLPELMRGLAKSVIKENPENIYVHAAEYFENLIRERDGELDRGYKNFSAYKVYSDYKEKCRVKGGGNGSLSAGSVGDIPSSAGGQAVRSRMASDGDDDSGASASATRGRRKRRVKKQGSKDSVNSLEKQDSVGSSTDAAQGGDDEKKSSSAEASRQENLDAIKEDSPAVEQTMVKVQQANLECQAPRERSINKSVSVDSVAAANAVSTVLENAVEEADEADKETGEAIETQVEADLAKELGHPINCEDVDSYPPDEEDNGPEDGNGEEYGSAPSTAEVGGLIVGEADVLVQDGAPNEVGSEQDVLEDTQKNADEVDLSINDSAYKNEEPEINGSEEVKSENLLEKQESGEIPTDGVDTVDAEKVVAELEEVGEFVPSLPDVPTDEPSAKEVEATDAVEVQVAPNVEKSDEKEHDDSEVIQENMNKSSNESDAIEKVLEEGELLRENDLEEESPTANGAAEDVQTKESEEGEANDQQNDDGPLKGDDLIPDVTANGNSAEVVGKTSQETVEGHDNVESAKQESLGNNVQNEMSHNDDQSLETDVLDAKPDNGSSHEEPTDGAVDTAVENTVAVDKASLDEDNQLSEKVELEAMSDNGSSHEGAPNQEPEDIPETSKTADESPQDDEVVADNSPKADTIELNEKSGNDSPEQSDSIEQHDSPPDKEETSVGEETKPAEMENAFPETVEEVLPDEPKPSSSPVLFKEPSRDEAKSELNGILEEVKPSSKESTEPSLEQTDSELNDKESDGLTKASKEASLDKSESELNQSLDLSNADPSKESSAKESEGESASVEAMSGQEKESSVDADEGKDTTEDQKQQLSFDKSAEVTDGENEQKEENGEEDVQTSAPPSEESTEHEAKNTEDNASNKEKSAEDGDNLLDTKQNSIKDIDDGSKEEEADTLDKSTPEDDASNKDKSAEEGDNHLDSRQNSNDTDDGSKEEVIEEPCIQRQVSPSASKIPSKQPSVELDEIKKVDLASFDKDSAEALFYTLKKSELENQESHPEDGKTKEIDKNFKEDDDDDEDVVLAAEEEPPTVSRQATKRSFTDDFLDNSPITGEVSNIAEGDGVIEKDGEASGDKIEVFNPMHAASVRNQQLQDQLHSRFAQDDTSALQRSPRKAMFHRSMTERRDLSRQDTDYVDLRKYDPDYVEEEDQFDGYYIGNLKNKILASSVSVADSDYYDQEQAEGSFDDNHVQTALETIASTDTESTLPSQTTIQANKGFLKRGSQNTSTNIPYASFGNSAINQSLEEFIDREEQLKEAEAQAASTIQRSYRRFRTNKKKLLRDYHSTMQTFTEDQSTESLEDYPSSVIQIKLDKKQQEQQESDNSFEDARMENRRRPMYSLNIDEYDTVTRRMTLTRGVAMQRNSTPEEDSGKSDNTSGEKKSPSDPASNMTIMMEESPITSSDLSSEEKKGSGTSSDEKENKDNSSSKSNAGRRSSAAILDDGKKSASLDVQKMFIVRQRTMPVQIETTVLRAQPKHTRKRIKSAGMIRK